MPKILVAQSVVLGLSGLKAENNNITNYHGIETNLTTLATRQPSPSFDDKFPKMYQEFRAWDDLVLTMNKTENGMIPLEKFLKAYLYSMRNWKSLSYAGAKFTDQFDNQLCTLAYNYLVSESIGSNHTVLSLNRTLLDTWQNASISFKNQTKYQWRQNCKNWKITAENIDSCSEFALHDLTIALQGMREYIGYVAGEYKTDIKIPYDFVDQFMNKYQVYDNFGYFLRRLVPWILSYVVPADRLEMEIYLFSTDAESSAELKNAGYLKPDNPEYRSIINDYWNNLRNMDVVLYPKDKSIDFDFVSEFDSTEFDVSPEQLCAIEWHGRRKHAFFDNVGLEQEMLVRDQVDNYYCSIKFC